MSCLARRLRCGEQQTSRQFRVKGDQVQKDTNKPMSAQSFNILQIDAPFTF